tara:strand:- start:772 stop:1050 length:279 start_codon:yes stop_codon:yes gene_type:complete
MKLKAKQVYLLLISEIVLLDKDDVFYPEFIVANHEFGLSFSNVENEEYLSFNNEQLNNTILEDGVLLIEDDSKTKHSIEIVRPIKIKESDIT